MKLLTLQEALEDYIRINDIGPEYPEFNRIFKLLEHTLKATPDNTVVRTNGCGTKATEFIPDVIGGCSITSACNIHDTLFFSKRAGYCDLTFRQIDKACHDLAMLIFVKEHRRRLRKNSSWHRVFGRIKARFDFFRQKRIITSYFSVCRAVNKD